MIVKQLLEIPVNIQNQTRSLMKFIETLNLFLFLHYQMCV